MKRILLAYHVSSQQEERKRPRAHDGTCQENVSEYYLFLKVRLGEDIATQVCTVIVMLTETNYIHPICTYPIRVIVAITLLPLLH